MGRHGTDNRLVISLAVVHPARMHKAYAVDGCEGIEAHDISDEQAVVGNRYLAFPSESA